MSDARLTYHLPPIDQSRDKQLETLTARKAELEGMIARRFMDARAEGVQVDVQALSAELREVKREIAVARSQTDGGACAGCGSLDFHWPTAKFSRGRSWCARCWKAQKAGGEPWSA